MSAEVTTLEIEPAGTARSTIIWLHGLGADAHDFEPIVPHLNVPPALGLRYVFPNAPIRPVTINGGMQMRAWYDIFSLDIPRVEDAAGVIESERIVTDLIWRETERGIPARRIVLAGFSQGGAIALHTGLRHPQPLAGILALSCYIPLAKSLDAERHPANHAVPIFLAHGLYDEVIPVHYGRSTGQQLEALAYQPERHEYGMGHEVNWDEIQDIAAWLPRVLNAGVGTH